MILCTCRGSSNILECYASFRRVFQRRAPRSRMIGYLLRHFARWAARAHSYSDPRRIQYDMLAIHLVQRSTPSISSSYYNPDTLLEPRGGCSISPVTIVGGLRNVLPSSVRDGALARQEIPVDIVEGILLVESLTDDLKCLFRADFVGSN